MKNVSEKLFKEDIHMHLSPIAVLGNVSCQMSNVQGVISIGKASWIQWRLFIKNNEVFHSILCILQENILLTLISKNSRSQRIDISEMNARLEARSEFIKRGMIKVIKLLILLI